MKPSPSESRRCLHKPSGGQASGGRMARVWYLPHLKLGLSDFLFSTDTKLTWISSKNLDLGSEEEGATRAWSGIWKETAKSFDLQMYFQRKLCVCTCRRGDRSRQGKRQWPPTKGARKQEMGVGNPVTASLQALWLHTTTPQRLLPSVWDSLWAESCCIGALATKWGLVTHHPCPFWPNCRTTMSVKGPKR